MRCPCTGALEAGAKPHASAAAPFEGRTSSPVTRDAARRHVVRRPVTRGAVSFRGDIHSFGSALRWRLSGRSANERGMDRCCDQRSRSGATDRDAANRSIEDRVRDFGDGCDAVYGAASPRRSSRPFQLDHSKPATPSKRRRASVFLRTLDRGAPF